MYYTNDAYRITPAIVAPILAAPVVLLILYIGMLIRVYRRKKKASQCADL